MFELELTGTGRSARTLAFREATSRYPSPVFSAGAQPAWLSPLNAPGQIQNLDPGSGPRDLLPTHQPKYFQIWRAYSISWVYAQNCKRTPVRWESSLPGARARINIWLTYGLWIFSSHSLGSCRGGVGVEYLICAYTAWGIWFKSNHTKTPVRKTRYNYFFLHFFPTLHTAF